MPPIRLFHGNRLEVLAGHLARSLARSSGSPLVSDIVVVSSRGMQRWLTLEIARINGVCANVSFPFPNAFIVDMMSRVLGGRRPNERFEPDTMALHVMGHLADLVASGGYADLEAYVRGDDGTRLYQLSSVVADLFDRYLVYRPDMVMGWEKGRMFFGGACEAWQKTLWSRLVTEASDHIAALREEFLAAVPHADPSVLPASVSVFGIGFMPPFYVDVLRALSARVEIDVYCLNPCREYWADIRSEHKISVIVDKAPGMDEGLLHLEVGNELIAGLGHMNREFLEIMLDADPYLVDMFDEPSDPGMLGCIQADILTLTRAAEKAPASVDPADRSIQVHVCHSPLREVEVVKDVLLSLFEDIPGLRPSDVCVMAPDIEPYVPSIRAVFDSDPADKTYIPYSISDRSLRGSGGISGCLLELLRLPMTRLEASVVLDILDREPVRRRFGMGEADVATIRGWVRDAAVCWGLDAKHRVAMGLPGWEENTWDHGMKRLLLGYAMGAGGGMFSSIAPIGEFDPSQADLLGRFCDFLERIGDWVRQCGQDREIWAWARLTERLLQDLIDANEDEADELRGLVEVVHRTERAAERASLVKKVPVSVFAQILERSVERPAEGAGFLERGVTFCSMLPMRSVPFQVIFLMGMTHDAFPRHDTSSGLDLMRLKRRKGDRSLRLDDLSMFLETIISARRVLAISYVGRGIQDNAEKPCSVVVSMLMDYIDRRFATDDGRAPSAGVTTIHHLQAFNPAYFTKGSSLFSYSGPNEKAAQALVAGETKKPAGNVQASGVQDEGMTIDFGRFLEFFLSPVRFFLKNRLGATLPREVQEPDDQEPLEVRGLERYALNERIMLGLASSAARQEIFERIRAQGLLPHGWTGRLVFDEVFDEIEDLWNRRLHACGERKRKRVYVEVALEKATIAGTLEVWGEDGRVITVRPAKIKPGDLMRAWLSLLVACAGGIPCDGAVHVGLDGEVNLSCPPDCRFELARLARVYRLGLERPVHLFPRSSYAFAREYAKGKEEPKALQEARKEWSNAWSGRSEADEEAHRLLFADTDPLDAEFAELSKIVFGALVACQKKDKGA